MAWALFANWRWGDANTRRHAGFSWTQRLEVLPRVLPFLLLVAAVVYVLYGGVATPSETAGVGAFFVIVLVVVIYRVWQPSSLWRISCPSAAVYP